MKKHSNSQSNNKGATLVMVLLIISFITILATVVTTAAMTNLKMKMVNRESTKTFYTAEDAVDEIYAALGKVSIEAFDEAYNEQMANIVENASEEKKAIQNDIYNRNLRTSYMNRLVNKLTEETITPAIPAGGDSEAYTYTTSYITGNTDDIKAKLVKKLNDSLENGGTGEALRVESIDGIQIVNEASTCTNNIKLQNYRYAFENCVIKYQSAEGYYSYITFNGIISMPDEMIDFYTVSTEGDDDFTTYSLIGTSGITLAGSDDIESGKADEIANVSIAGNAFAGGAKGMELHQFSSAQLSNGTLISNSNIQLDDETIFSAGSVDIWCENIQVKGNGATLNIDGGTSYVKDDLQIDSNGSGTTKVKIGGIYNGYGYQKSNNLTHADSSAIIINSKGVNLDFSSLGRLVIAGNAFIDYSQAMLTSGYAGTSLQDTVYSTGNSIDLIGLQEIYLVPTTFMGENEPNPNVSGTHESVVEEKLRDLFFAKSLLKSQDEVDVKEVDGKYYYYLNFKDNSAKQTYFKAIVDDDAYHTLISNKSDESTPAAYDTAREYVKNLIRVNLTDMGSFITGLENAQVDTNGSLIQTVRSASGETISATVGESTNDAVYFENLSKQYSGNYLGLRKKLVMDSNTLLENEKDNTSSVFSNLIDKTKLSELTSPYSKVENGKIKYADNGTIRSTIRLSDIAGDVKEGAIITGGNVIVDQDFSGMIFAEGMITIEGNVTLSNAISGSSVYNLLKNDENMVNILKGWSIGSDSDVEISHVQVEKFTYKDFVNIANWRNYEEKNETETK